MALYKIGDTGEAVRTDMNGHKEWLNGRDMDTLTIARHHIVKTDGVVYYVDARKCQHPEGKILATIYTRLRMSTEAESQLPWETWVEGERDYRWSSETRAQAIDCHKSTVNEKLFDNGGKVPIR